jgi:outer membrane usher protein
MFREPIANRRWRASRPPFIPFVAVTLLSAGSSTAWATESVALQGSAPGDLPSLWASGILPARGPLGARIALDSQRNDAAVAPTPNRDVPPERASPTIAQAPAVPGIPVSPPLEAIIVTVSVNGVARGTAPILRDGKKRLFVPATDFRSWNLSIPDGTIIRLQGIEHVDLGRVPELQARFDEKRIALEITVPAGELPKSTIDLRWHYKDALRPTQPSAFFNYALTVTGDESFNSSRTQVTTEVGGRMGDTLFYSSGTYADQAGSRGYTRLQTNATFDQRDTLRRLIAGDFFTPVGALSASVPMGGVSFSKYYAMDPFFIQYPTLNLNTTVALPSQVEVRIDGNVVARQQMRPGPVDIVNITGYTGARNVQVVVRDAFGREQVYQQPYYFTDFALKEGLHEYSYNLGFIRENYGVESNDYGKPAFSGFHRYGFTDRLTLGLAGEAREGMVNAGPIATVLLPGAGIVGAGVSVSNGQGSTGYAGSFFYSFIAPRYSVNANARHFGDDYRVLPSAEPIQTRNFASASFTYSPTAQGTISTSYTVTEPRSLESLHAWNVGYNMSLFGGHGILTLGYTKNSGLVDDWIGSVVFRYLFDGDYSVVASAGRAGNFKNQAVSFEKTVPAGEGYGFSIGPGRAESPQGTTTLANAFGQYNGRYAALLARYVGSSNDRIDRGLAEVSVASGIGYVPGRLFVSRPLTDSFAVVKVGDVPDVPVLANGQFQGRTDEHGEVVVSPMISFYDNYIGFEQRAVPLDYIYKSTQLVASPAFRSGSYLKFDVKKNRAVLGRLVHEVKGQRVPIEFRELKVTRTGVDIRSWEALYGPGFFLQSFTAKGGEFYIEQLEPGEWLLQVEEDGGCVATIQVPKTEEALTELGAVLCAPARPERSSQKP